MITYFILIYIFRRYCGLLNIFHAALIILSTHMDVDALKLNFHLTFRSLQRIQLSWRTNFCTNIFHVAAHHGHLQVMEAINNIEKIMWMNVIKHP